jgi:TRAP-type mannitol/chloroaromatic compound transport system permease small subunit
MTAAVHPLNRLLALLTSALVLITVALTFAVVVARYVFGVGSLAAQDAIMYAHASAFMLAMSYALKRDQHVRVDIFYRAMRARNKAIVDMLGTILFLLPSCVLIIWMSADYVADSWRVWEASKDSGGLPGVFLIKSLIPLSALLLIVQALVMLPAAMRSIRAKS